MKQKLFMALLLLLTVASCNKKRVSKESQTPTAEIQKRAGGLTVGTLTGYDLRPSYSPLNYFLNSNNIPWKLQVMSLNFKELGGYIRPDLDPTKNYILLVDTSGLNSTGNTVNWNNAVKVSIAANTMVGDSVTIKLASPWKISRLLPNADLIRKLPTQLWSADATGLVLDEPVMTDLKLEIPFVPEFTSLPLGVTPGYTVSGIPAIADLNAMMPNNVVFPVTFTPDAGLLAAQLASGAVYGVGMNVVVTCTDGTIQTVRPRNSDFTTLFSIPSRTSTFTLNVDLGLICRIKNLLIKSYVYNSQSAPAAGVNQVITVGDLLKLDLLTSWGVVSNLPTLSVGSIITNNTNITIDYTGGSGSAYLAGSTVVDGITLSWVAGTLTNSTGTVSFALSGTPSASGTVTFTVFGHTISLNVSGPSMPNP